MLITNELLKAILGTKRGFLYIDLDDDKNEDIGRYFEQTHDFIKRHLERGFNVYVRRVATYNFKTF